MLFGIPWWVYAIAAIAVLIIIGRINSGGGQSEGAPQPEPREEVEKALVAIDIVREIANRCGPMPSSTSSSPAPLTPEEQAGVDEILALMESGALVLPATVYRWKFEDNNGHPMRPKSLYNTLRLYLWHNNGRGAIYPS